MRHRVKRFFSLSLEKFYSWISPSMSWMRRKKKKRKFLCAEKFKTRGKVLSAKDFGKLFSSRAHLHSRKSFNINSFPHIPFLSSALLPFFHSFLSATWTEMKLEDKRYFFRLVYEDLRAGVRWWNLCFAKSCFKLDVGSTHIPIHTPWTIECGTDIPEVLHSFKFILIENVLKFILRGFSHQF